MSLSHRIGRFPVDVFGIWSRLVRPGRLGLVVILEFDGAGDPQTRLQLAPPKTELLPFANPTVDESENRGRRSGRAKLDRFELRPIQMDQTRSERRRELKKTIDTDRIDGSQ
jgi:hypothetical protein